MCISRNLSAFRVAPLPALISPDFYNEEGSSSNTNHPGRNHFSAHHVVQHNYHDLSHQVDLKKAEPVVRGGVTTPFPIKLHEMLEEIEQDGLADVISWQPHGRCFVVHKPKEFVEHVMPTYFKQTKLPSFQRQLNLYGFQRLTKGPDRGGYYHELFLRGKVFLSHEMQRVRVKGTGVRARSNPAKEPNFYNMESLTSNTCAESCSSPQEVISSAPVTPESASSDASTNKFTDATDVLGEFEGMIFHLVDAEPKELCQAKPNGESYLDCLDISNGLYKDILASIEDDVAFGDLLQRMIE